MKQADAVYAKSRLDLIGIEQAEFKSLLLNVPNCYKPGSDDTLWGKFLLSAAQQLARIEFMNQYLYYGADPTYLNPVDIKRRFAGPLLINRNYPGKTQFDLDYKTMVLSLLAAYKNGSTRQCIQDVVDAYVGTSYPVQELYKTSPDPSDRNSLRVGVSLAQSLDTINELGHVQSIIENIYTAIDLGKPAHVGIALTATVQDEDLVDVFDDMDDNIIRVLVRHIEEEPGDPVFMQGPFESDNSPVTGLGPTLPEYSYQWYWNDVAIEGATASGLTLTSVSITVDDGAVFHVVITDPRLGSVTSNKATLSVTPVGSTAPRPKRVLKAAPSKSDLVVAVQPLSLSLYEGQDATFTVTPDTKIKPGILAPRINQVWEIESDTLIGLDL